MQYAAPRNFCHTTYSHFELPKGFSEGDSIDLVSMRIIWSRSLHLGIAIECLHFCALRCCRLQSQLALACIVLSIA